MFKGDVPWPQPDGSIKYGPNKIWEDELELVSMSKIRSGVSFIYKSKRTGYKYEFVCWHIYHLMQTLGDVRVLAGKFIWYKAGSAYYVEVA